MPEKMDFFVLDILTHPGIKMRLGKSGTHESKRRKLSIGPEEDLHYSGAGAGAGNGFEEQSSSSSGSGYSPSPPPPALINSIIDELSTAPVSEEISTPSDNSESAEEKIATTPTSPDDIRLIDNDGIGLQQYSYEEEQETLRKLNQDNEQLSVSDTMSIPAAIPECQEDDELSLEVEDSIIIDNQGSSEEEEYRDMPRLFSPIKLQSFDMSQSPVMPVLSPEFYPIDERNYQKICRRALFGKGDSPEGSTSSSDSSSNSKDYENVNLTDGGTFREADSSSERSLSKKATKPRKLGHPINGSPCPSPGQISLRGYYYGRWNWGEDAARVLFTNKKKQKKKWHFEAEFSRNLEWRMEMETPVLCLCCPAEIKKNTDIVTHIMEHIKLGDSGKWELMKFETAPKVSSLLSQCRLCFVKCPTLLNSHMKNTHQHVTDLCCRICEIDLKAVDTMSLHHSKFHHVAEMPFCCPICDCRSSFRWDIVQHFQLKHGKENNALCPYCMKLFDVSIPLGMLILQYHLLTHKAEQEISCPRCCLKFVDTEDFDLHLFHHHHPPSDMHGDTFHDPETGFQCFKEEDKRRPIFIAHPKRTTVTNEQSSNLTSVI